jgi:peptidoglycan hydrolase CwlO-like protein
MEQGLQTVQSQLQVLHAKIALKNEKIKKLYQDVQSLCRPIEPWNKILLKRRLEIALKIKKPPAVL